MVLERQRAPLRETVLPIPAPGHEQLLLAVRACGVCRTDLHIVDGELTRPKLPLVPGHQVVGRVIGIGDQVRGFQLGDRVGVPWLGWTCGRCRYCVSGRENLCDLARFTGYDLDGGFAEYAVAHHRFCFPVPAGAPATAIAPLLCAGLIGYRALRMAGEARVLGFYGFGAAAHILVQVARHRDQEVFAFTRPGDEEGQRFARELGATWAGASGEAPPEPLDAAIIFAPAGPLVLDALRAVRKGGVVVCAGIHMSDIPPIPYELLWGERSVRSVANLTRRDGIELLGLAKAVPIRTTVRTFALAEANDALDRLRAGDINGAAVLVLADDQDF
jgi:propanol-preferring alcohol dehydrogenase